MLDQAFGFKRWCVLMTKPKAERIAEQQCREAAIETFLPLHIPKPAQGQGLRVDPIWPGYLFVAACSVPATVRAARGLIATETGYPIYVPHGLVESYIAQADKDGIIEKYEPPEVYKPAIGEYVRLIYGPLAGQFGTVTDVCKARVKLEFSCVGRKLMLTVKSEQVAPAA